jgi:hypothetical protein
MPLVLGPCRCSWACRASLGLRRSPSQATTPQTSTVTNYKSKYLGVNWHRPTKKWVANIGIQGQLLYLGFFDNEVEAAIAFDKLAAPLGRPVNFPGPGQAPAVKRGAHGIVSQYKVVSWHNERRRYFIVAPWPFPAVPLVVRRRCLIVVYRPLPAAPLVVRCMYMAVVSGPMSTALISRCCRRRF